MNIIKIILILIMLYEFYRFVMYLYFGILNYVCNFWIFLLGYKLYNIDIKVLNYYIIFIYFILELNNIYVL